MKHIVTLNTRDIEKSAKNGKQPTWLVDRELEDNPEQGFEFKNKVELLNLFSYGFQEDFIWRESAR